MHVGDTVGFQEYMNKKLVLVVPVLSTSDMPFFSAGTPRIHNIDYANCKHPIKILSIKLLRDTCKDSLYTKM